MNTINPELVVTEKKLKAAARRLNDVLANAGVNSDLKYAESLNVFSKGLFGISYEEVLATLLNKNPALNTSSGAASGADSVYLVEVGGNTIVVVNGEYDQATCPGTDLEVPYQAVVRHAESVASALGVTVQRYTMPEAIACLEVDHDGQYVDYMRMMGFFRPEGSLFEALCTADLIQINSMSIICADFMGADTFEDGFSLDECVWDPDCVHIGEPDEYELDFSFNELCSARKTDKGWEIYSAKCEETFLLELFYKS